MKKKIVSLSMRDQMYEALRDLIVTNSYEPNSVLQIDGLAEEFGVSATPVREALVRLEAEGLVSLIPNKGAQVTGIHETDIVNTWEMRRLLEPYAASQSLESIPIAEVEELRAEILRLKTEPFDNGRYVDTDSRLHQMLYSHHPNAMLKDTVRRIHQMSSRIRYFPEGSSAMHERVVNEVIAEHLAILDAIVTRDRIKAAAYVVSHLENGEKRAMAALASKS